MNKESIRELVEWFEEATAWARVAVKEASEAGTPIIGLYCGYIPSEIIRASGALAVGLCGSTPAAVADGEVALPRNFCPLIKSSYGLAITDTCPYFHFADALIGETTCDGKKKAFELFGEMKPTHVMQLPYDADTERAYEQWRAEIDRVVGFIEGVTGTTITAESLSREIHDANEVRALLADVASTFEAEHPLLSWEEMLVVQNAGGFLTDRSTYKEKLRELAEALRATPLVTEAGNGRPRVLLTGTPIAPTTNKVMRLIDEAGGRVVCHDACSGVKMYDRLVDETGDPLESLTRYTLGLPCACMSPNPGRIDLLAKSVERYRIQGVVENVWQACHTFNVESVVVGRACENDLKIPHLKLETDYAESDLDQLRVRIEAFVEMLR